jgi:hypothetical protein
VSGNHKFLKFCAKEQDMKGFTPDMLVQQLKEKYKISDILNIKYMGRDKDWIDYINVVILIDFVDIVNQPKSSQTKIPV